jgi:hypothetical protein
MTTEASPDPTSSPAPKVARVSLANCWRPFSEEEPKLVEHHEIRYSLADVALNPPESALEKYN